MHLLLLLACSGSDPAPSTDETSPSPTEESGVVDSGTDGSCLEGALVHTPNVGSYEQTDLVDGLVLQLTQGPQGGYHIDMNGVISPVPDQGVVVMGEVLLDDGTQVAFTDGSQAAYTEWADCEGRYGQARMFWNAELGAQDLCGFRGRPATFTQTVEDIGTGRTVSDVFEVVFDVVLFNGTCDDVTWP